MTEKKLFPGATEKETQKRQKAIQVSKEKVAAAVAEEEKKKEQKRLHNLYNKSILPFKWKIGLIAVLNLVIGELYRVVADYEEDVPGMSPTERVTMGEALKETYIPTYHYHPGDYGDGINSGYGKIESEPNPRWMMHMIVLLAEALVLSLLAINNAKRNKQINLMAEIAKISKEQNIDPKYIKKMLKVAPDIIENMSKDSRVYFDMLIEGKLDIEKAPAFLDMAISIMEGHLQTHPEDLQIVLNSFDERSIPESIKQMAAQKPSKDR